MMRALLKANSIKGSERLLLVGHRVKVLGEHHIFERGEIGNQMELLEDESNFLGSEAIEFGAGEFAQILAINENVSRAGTVETSNQIHQRRLA